MATANKVVFFSASPFGTGDIKTGSPDIAITAVGEASLSVAQTGNIGAGDCIDYGVGNVKLYITPCRIVYNSGSLEIKINDKIRGVTSGATGIVRAVTVTAGSWAGGDATGNIYFSKITGTFTFGENLNRVRPTSAANIATINGTLIGNMSTTFSVTYADGEIPGQVFPAETVNSIHHEYSSLDAADAGCTDANHINNTDFRATFGANIMVHITGYYDHDDYTLDTTNFVQAANTSDIDHYIYYYTPKGGTESINDQRHDGKWNSNKYIIETTVGDVVTLSEITRFEGFQLHQNGSSASHGINRSQAYVLYCGYNIIKATISGGDTNCYGIYSQALAGTFIYNNIIYDWINGSKNNIAVYITDQAVLYDNTIFNCNHGIDNDGVVNTIYLKNNIVNDCEDICYGPANTFHATSTCNIGNGAASELAFGATYKTGQADATAAFKLKDADAQFITNGVKVGCVVKNTTDTTYTRVTALDGEGQLSLADDIFISGENYSIYTNKVGDVTFNNEGADDFHLGAGDAFAKNLGTNLSADANLPFWDDIDGDERL